MKAKKIIALSAIIMLVLSCVIAAKAFSDLLDMKFKDKQPGFVPFSYTLKDSYSSRDEVLAELETIGDAFKRNIERCSDEYVQSVYPEYSDLKDRLIEELARFPDPSPLTAQQKFEHDLHFFKSEYIHWKVTYEGETNQKDKEIYREKYSRAKEIYEKYLELKAKLDAKEITAEQAYEEGSKLKMYPEPLK